MTKRSLTVVLALALLCVGALAQDRMEVWNRNAGVWTSHPAEHKMHAARRQAEVATPLVQSFTLPTDRDVVLVCGYDGVLRAVWGARQKTRVDSMTIVTDLPGQDFQKCGIALGGTIFALSSKGLSRIQDNGQGFASSIDQYPTVGLADALIAQASNSVTLGRINNPFVLQQFVDTNQVNAQSGSGLRSVGYGIASGIYLNNGDLYTLDIVNQDVVLLKSNSRQAQIYYHVPTSNAVGLATNDQKNQVYVLLAVVQGGNNQTCSDPCLPSVSTGPSFPGQIIQLQQALGPQGPFVNAVPLLTGGMLNGVQFGPHTFFVSKGVAYISIYAQGDAYHEGGNELWAFDFTQPNAAYTFLPREFAPNMADAALYPPVTNAVQQQ